jgi:protein involved in polysaccharide export with SLBB domain
MQKPISVLLIIILNLTFFICNLSFASDYLLAPTDQLEIKIIGQSDLDTKQTIAPDGSISLPLIGRILAGGKTMF